MAEESMFRFLLVRPSRMPGEPAPMPTRIPLYASDEGTPFATSLAELEAGGASPAAVARTIGAFRKTPGYAPELAAIGLDLAPVLAALASAGRAKLADFDVKKALETAFGEALATLVARPAFSKAAERVADTLFAEALLPEARAAWRQTLVSTHKALWVTRALAGGASPPSEGTLGRWFEGMTVVLPRTLRPRETPEASKPPAPKPKPDLKAAVDARVAELEHAHLELSRLATDENALVRPKSSTASPGTGRPARSARAAVASAAAAAGPGEAVPAAGASEVLRFTPAAVASLSETTRRTLTALKVDRNAVHPTGVVGRIEEEMREVVKTVGSTLPTNKVVALGGVMINRDKLFESFVPGPPPSGGTPDPAEPHVCDFQAGVGDLLIVRQKLKAYELGEFAHVENVMAGESKVREHRRLSLREEIETESEERETEKERDLQSTERNETQSEAEKTVRSQFNLESGLQISGSYGPSVSFSANLGTSFSTSTDESQRKAVSYSREVSDKTSERVREQVKRELRRRVLEQNEELNRHALENGGPGASHRRGIFRWLNKVYDAQILNYGQRMMYEFVVPEPAAFFLYATLENPPADTEMIKPEAPSYLGAPLRPTNITRTNYTNWVAQYQVRNVPAPPPEFQHAAYFDKQDRVEATTFSRSGKLEIPSGYEAYAASVLADYSFPSAIPHGFRVLIGNTAIDCSGSWAPRYRTLDRRYKELAVVYQAHIVRSFTLGIDVYCRLTTEGFARWQQSVYDAILEAYLQQKADFDERQAAEGIRRGVPVLGRNPLENRRIERDEIKKLVLMILTRTLAIARDSMLPSAEPRLNLDALCENGAFIRFFENAFEWNNVLYVHYPYFWGRTARWISALHFSDPDPDFAAFLKAGAARVQVPVRPGFEKAVAYFCQFQQIWEGGDPPLRDDELYVPIVDEIAENLGGLDAGVPYPEGAEPWEVRVPTSLVVVQNLEEIPHIRDELTGSDIALS